MESSNGLRNNMGERDDSTIEMSTYTTSIQAQTSQPPQNDQSGLIAALVIVSLLLVAIVIFIIVYIVRKRYICHPSELRFDTSQNGVLHQSIRYDSGHSMIGSQTPPLNKGFQKEDTTIYHTLENEAALEHPPEEVKPKESKDYHEIEIIANTATDDYHHLGAGGNSVTAARKQPDNYNHVSTVMTDYRGYNIAGSEVSQAHFNNDYHHIDQDYNRDIAGDRDQDEIDHRNKDSVTDMDTSDIALRESKPDRVQRYKNCTILDKTETGYCNIDVDGFDGFYVNDGQERDNGVEVGSLFVREKREVDTICQQDSSHGEEGEEIYENDRAQNEETTSIYEVAESI